MNISIERLEQIEMEREATMVDPKFQRWMKMLNVSRTHCDPTPRFNAQVMNSQYTFSPRPKVARLLEMFYL